MTSPDLTKSSPRHQAVLMAFEAYERRHYENLARAVRVLKKSGYDERDISVYSGSKYMEVEGISVRPISILTVEHKFGDLQAKLTEEDQLFVYVTGHGHQARYLPIGNLDQDGFSYVNASDGVILDRHFANYFSEINAGSIVSIFDQCYGGGFARLMGTGSQIGISASSASQISFSDAFPQHFFDSFNPYSIAQTPSIGSAFSSAKTAVEKTYSEKQTPQIFGEVDMDKLYLGEAMVRRAIS